MKEHPIKYIESFGLKLWLLQVTILFLNKIAPKIKINQKLKAKKHALILDILKTKYSSLIAEYKTKDIKNITSDKVWVMWYQGQEEMPEIVKLCYHTVQDNITDSEIIFLSKNNISKYIELPQYIMEKYQKNMICNANFSDIIRMCLLKNYGGLWIDSTIYVTKKLNKKEIESIKTVKAPCNDITSISKGMWTSFCLGSLPTKLYSFAYDFFITFFKEEEIQIDYFLVDYVIRIAYEEFPEIKEAIDKNKTNNQNIHLLCNKLNDIYSENDYQKILETNFFHKLSFKIPLKNFVNNQETYYQKILNRSKTK